MFLKPKLLESNIGNTEFSFFELYTRRHLHEAGGAFNNCLVGSESEFYPKLLLVDRFHFFSLEDADGNIVAVMLFDKESKQMTQIEMAYTLSDEEKVQTIKGITNYLFKKYGIKKFHGLHNEVFSDHYSDLVLTAEGRIVEIQSYYMYMMTRDAEYRDNMIGETPEARSIIAGTYYLYESEGIDHQFLRDMDFSNINVVANGNINPESLVALGPVRSLTIVHNDVLTELPDLEIEEDFTIDNCQNLSTLPSVLKVQNKLDIMYCPEIEKWPEIISANFIYFRYLTANTLPKSIHVGRDLNIFSCPNITELPQNLHVPRILTLDKTGIQQLPNDIYFGRIVRD